MNGESKTTVRFTWRDWLRAIFILVLLIYTIVELTYRFSLPTDGWMVTENELPGLTYIQNILGEGSPLQAGDRVIAVDGNPVDYEVFSTSASIQDAWQFGAVLQYSVVRDGQEIIVPVKLVHWQLGTLGDEQAARPQPTDRFVFHPGSACGRRGDLHPPARQPGRIPVPDHYHVLFAHNLERDAAIWIPGLD